MQEPVPESRVVPLPQKDNGTKQKLGWMVTVVASVALGAAAVVGIDSIHHHNNSGPAVIERTTGSTTSKVSDTIQDVSDLYAKVRPSVVQVNSTGRNSGLGSGSSSTKTATSDEQPRHCRWHAVRRAIPRRHFDRGQGARHRPR